MRFATSILIAATMGCALLGLSSEARAEDRIKPYGENPFYWQYQGEPVLLLGGSWQDNLFNHPDGLEEHLDTLAEAGGNYVRNTMSTREPGNLWPFVEVEDGLFDLDQLNEPYWERFEAFLDLTLERDIIVQIEVWDPHDYHADPNIGWRVNPFNPLNNVNYTAGESGLPETVDHRPGPEPTPHPMWRTPPTLDDNPLVLGYQKAIVDRMLDIAMPYPHVLYCMSNEMGERHEWSDYWAAHIHARASEAGFEVYVSDMRRNEDVSHPDHRHMYSKPDLYTFVDVSQNNTHSGQLHFDRIQFVRDQLNDHGVRPINHNKIYSIRGGHSEAIQRFFRIVFGGGASARFHRPYPIEDAGQMYAETRWGLGLHPTAQQAIRSARMAADAFPLVNTEPRKDLLEDREPNEAYCLAQPGEAYAVYFPNGGQVALDVSAAQGRPLDVRWLDISHSEWREPRNIDAAETLELTAPSEDHWAVLVLVRQ